MTNKRKDPNSILRFSGMALQFAVLIGLGLYGGMQLDTYLGNEKGIFAALGSVLMLFAGFYLIMKEVKKMS